MQLTKQAAKPVLLYPVKKTYFLQPGNNLLKAMNHIIDFSQPVLAFSHPAM